MSGTIPPIPPPFGASSGNPSSPNVNRVDTMPTTIDIINTTTTTNIAQSVVDENLPQLLDSKGGSHVTNVLAFDNEDFTSWKVRFLVFLDGLESYRLKTLEDGPFIPMSSLSTTENPLPKRQNQWLNAESRLTNQDKRLKSIIISCLPNDVMKFVIKCKSAKEMWNDLILAHGGPSDTRDTKIAALRIKFNAFKSLEGEKVMGTFIRLKCLLNDLENNSVTIPQAEVNAMFVNSLPRKWLSMNQTQRANNSIKNDSLATLYGKYNMRKDSDSDVEEDQRTSNAFLADLNTEYHERALLANQKRFYKRSGRVGSTMKPIDKTKETCFAWKSKKGKNDKGKYVKGLIAESFDWDEESVSSKDEGTTRIRAFMAIAKDEPSVGKADARSEDQRKNMVNKYNLLKQELSLHKFELSNLKNIIPINCSFQNKVNLENESLKDEISDLKKAYVSTSESALMITSDSEDDSDNQEPLPPLPKLTRVDLFGASKSLISLSDLTVNMADLTLNTASKEMKKSTNKVSQTYVIKKKTKSKNPAVQSSCPDKNDLPSTEQLLLTLMEEVKGIKNQILIPSDTSLSVSQADSSKTPKQKVLYRPCKHRGMKNRLFDNCYSKPKCSTCGSISHTTKEHTEQTAVRKSLIKLKGHSTSKSTPVRTTRMPKTFSEYKYYGSKKHHPDDCEFYPGCEICGSIAHEIADCLKNLRNRLLKEVGPKVLFGDDSSGNTEGFGSVNYNGITFTRVTYVNGLKHNLISISQLCDANYKVLFTKTQGTIFNQKDEVVLIAPRRRDVYVIDMSSFNKDSNACFLAKASLSINWLWHKRLSHLNFKNINNLTKHSLVSGIPSLTFSKDKNCSVCEKGKHHRASFKTKRSFSINKSLHLLHMDLFGPGEAVNTPCYTQNRSIIVKRHGKTAYDVFRGRSPDISYFHVFGCHVYIHNHRDHLGKFDENANDGFFLGYSLVAKAFRVFNIRRQEMEETVHVTFSEDDKAISQTSTEGDAINFNENRSFPDDDFIEPRSKDTQCSVNINYIPYISTYENITLVVLPTLQNFVTSEETHEFIIADDLLDSHEPDHAESADTLESIEPQDNVQGESISDDQPAPIISPSAKVIL
ncbi:retrovirus-related pol polyprotein from transposon TNT 1-94 [Tanacetum coccineum]